MQTINSNFDIQFYGSLKANLDKFNFYSDHFTLKENLCTISKYFEETKLAGKCEFSSRWVPYT